MIPKLIYTPDRRKIDTNTSFVYLFKNLNEFQLLCKDEKLHHFVKQNIEGRQEIFFLKSLESIDVFIEIDPKKEKFDALESARRKAAKVHELVISSAFDKVAVFCNDVALERAFIEGLILSDYRFDYYKSNPESKKIKEVFIGFDSAAGGLNELLSAVYWSRDLINEPPAELTANNLSEKFEKLGEQLDIEVEVLGKARIESLKMGGLLAVNRGSVQEPTFNILTYKPKNAKNDKPIVLVGKGVVYDTGGINLKPTGYLETMKSDMSGSAVVSGLIKAAAANNLPVYIIALVPATDNRPGKDAIVPGDIITMHNGKTVEIINTDAEGRLVLADGLSFSEKYHPQLVISVATLTGAAKAAFGDRVIAGMGNANGQLANLISAGFESGERVAELPFWTDYGEEVKSKIADLKNLGGKTSGAITAGKFLENFTDSPYIHLDIAGVSFLEKDDYYRPAGGTGTGVRLLYQFIKNTFGNEQ